MLALTLLPFLLFTGFTASFAAPSRRQTDCIPPQALYLPEYQTTITPPDETLQFVTLGVGIQFYNCSPQGTYTYTGASDNVFDISPLYPSPLFYNVQNLAYADWLSYEGFNFAQHITDTYGAELVGRHFFEYDANGLTPVWNFTEVYGPSAVALGVVVGDLPSPDSDPGSVDWQHLYVTSGSLAQEILLIYTNGGEPPSQCLPGSEISVKFTAQYWLYGGPVGAC